MIEPYFHATKSSDNRLISARGRQIFNVRPGASLFFLVVLARMIQGKPELQEKTKVKERSSSKRISCVVLLFFCLLLINNKKNTELF